jgi:dipeptidyl aminopeptidase/acylaminoacyl peptidase
MVYRVKFIFQLLFLSTLILFTLWGCQFVESNRIPVEDFFPSVEKSNFRISPDGRYVSYLKVGNNQNRKIYVQDMLLDDSTPLLVSDSATNVISYFWATDSLLLFTSNAPSSDMTQLYAIDLDNHLIKPVLPPSKSRVRFLSSVYSNHEEVLITSNERDSSMFDVYRLNVPKGKKELIGENPGNIIRWIADLDGKLRLAIASDSVQESILYRPKEQDQFKVISSNSFHTTINPLGFVQGKKNHIFALSNLGRDKISLVEFDLESQKETNLLFSHTEVDVASGGYARNKGTMSYAYYFTWKRDRHFLDDSARMMFERIEERLPGYDVRVIDESWANHRLIINAFTDRNPGVFYYYDGVQNKLVKLSETNPKLNELELAVMRPVSFVTKDGIRLHGYLTMPNNAPSQNLPVIVYPHSGPSDRNSWGYSSEVQFFANRGYAVFQLNYRGSAGYGKSFRSAGFKEWGGKIQDDITEGVEWLINEKIADPKRIGIFGMGFGGYSALHAACFNSSLYAAAASYGGFTNLFTQLKEIPPHLKPHLQMYYEIIGNPETESDLIKAMSPVFHSDNVNIPVFIAQGGKDSKSSVTETNQFVKKLQNRNIPVKYMLREEEGRFFRKEENLIQFYEELGKFFDEHLKK